MERKKNIIINKWYGWKFYKINQFDVWFNGYILNDSHISFLNKGVELLTNDLSSNDDIDSWVRNAQGHFSFLISNSQKVLCGVDRVRTIPLFYTFNSKEIIVGNYAPDISSIVSKNENKYNNQAVLELAMSGYTIGKKTLHSRIFQLCAGELLISINNEVEVRKYYQYMPWRIKNRSKAQLKKELTEVSRSVLDDMVKESQGRQIVIPLSAGHDSRFIASGLRELNVKNVFCFSYGTDNNFEVETAKNVAEHLKYPWLFIPLSISSQRKIFSEPSFKDFWKFSDTLSNNPVLIDYSAVKMLKQSGKISKDAIFVNGNSGDFITGGHIDAGFSNDNILSIKQLTKSIFNKHYSLWGCLKSEVNISKIHDELENSILNLIDYYGLTLNDLSEIGENIEWYGRQSKIVTKTQRSYEFHGYEWRLPMWDPVYMDFWESVERKYKLNQLLYTEMLLENNWGGVWKGVKVNNYSISLDKLKLLRNIMKIFFVIFGRDAWRRFDRRFFAYFYDITAATAIVPYKKVLFDMRGYRNRNSWIVEKYLTGKGIDILSQKFK